MKCFGKSLVVLPTVAFFSACGLDIERVVNEDFLGGEASEVELTLAPASVQDIDVDGNNELNLAFGAPV